MRQGPFIRAALLALAATTLPAQGFAATYSEVGNTESQKASEAESSREAASKCEQYLQEKTAILDSIPDNLDPESKQAMQHLSPDQKERLEELRSLQADCS